MMDFVALRLQASRITQHKKLVEVWRREDTPSLINDGNSVHTLAQQSDSCFEGIFSCRLLDAKEALARATGLGLSDKDHFAAHMHPVGRMRVAGLSKKRALTGQVEARAVPFPQRVWELSTTGTLRLYSGTANGSLRHH